MSCSFVALPVLHDYLHCIHNGQIDLQLLFTWDLGQEALGVSHEQEEVSQEKWQRSKLGRDSDGRIQKGEAEMKQSSYQRPWVSMRLQDGKEFWSSPNVAKNT